MIGLILFYGVVIALLVLTQRALHREEERLHRLRELDLLLRVFSQTLPFTSQSIAKLGISANVAAEKLTTFQELLRRGQNKANERNRSAYAAERCRRTKNS